MKISTRCVLVGLVCLVLAGLVCCAAPMSAQSPSGAPPSNAPANVSKGTTGYIPVWVNPSTLGNSRLFQNSAGDIGLGTATPAATLDINGTINAASSFNLRENVFAFGSLANGNAFLGFSGNATTTGSDNTANGAGALQSNTTGSNNTASGVKALWANTEGYSNTADGLDVLVRNTTGKDNTASGIESLSFNTSGEGNTAVGAYGLENSTGDENTAMGFWALSSNTSGSYNTALGSHAGPDSNSSNLTNATAIGAYATVSESNALVLGGTGQYAVRVGIGTATPSNVFTIAQGSGVAISDGWNTYSSRRWKTNIHTLRGALEQVQQLRGVSYDMADTGKHEIGVIAEEVANIVPEVVSSDKNGRVQGVDYSRLVALLIEAVKQQQQEIRAQQAQITQLSSHLAAMRVSLSGGVANQEDLQQNAATNQRDRAVVLNNVSDLK